MRDGCVVARGATQPCTDLVGPLSGPSHSLLADDVSPGRLLGLVLKAKV